ncbi:MAG: tetratricopeptide repeat protein [Mizugakiibacter sp.]|uniref:tetratricopeptide repeat protein n=1 Tax=Mizugakiibacter sp. TaxID=1972610 RepID=UPI0031BF6E1B|nr:tetratricopeptide repeat protein [Xanthomonadaceae bacterium]
MLMGLCAMLVCPTVPCAQDRQVAAVVTAKTRMAPAMKPAAADGPAEVPARGHVGSATCSECHAAEAAAWNKSQHRHAMQVADAESVLGDFHNATFAYAGTTSTFSLRGGRYFVRTDGADGKLADYEVRYTFGVAPLQQYLIAMPGGRLQALSIAWDTRTKAQGGQRWFHLYPKQAIKAGDPLHWTGVDQNWNFMCAECHSTDLRKNFDAARDRFDTQWSEIDVACEACHGPGAAHVAWARAKSAGKPAGADNGLALALTERKGVTWAIDAATGTARRSVARRTSKEIQMCARCHARSSRLSDDYVFGAPLLDSHRLADLDPGLYWTDGQMRDEVYNLGPFLQSRMQAKGVTCSDCHDPHTQALRFPGNAICTQCHLASKYDAVAHTHHAAGSAGSGCPQCHMPTTTYMQVDPRHDHSFRVPRPDLSVTLGVPNACNSCHTKQTPRWAADALIKWTGKTPVGFQDFATAFHDGETGAPGARAALAKLIDDPAQPAIVRASAIDRLARWLTPSSLGSVTNALADPDPSVRLAAVGAIGGNTDVATRVRWLPSLLADPVLSVRIEVARALAGEAEAALPAASSGELKKALGEYIAVQDYNADRPEGHANLANLYAARGDPERAAAEYRKAIGIDPTFVAAYVNLADLDRAMGSEDEAIAVLERGLKRAPRAAALHYALALAYVRGKRNIDALGELAEAARLAPDSARYAYVYAVALNDAGRVPEALKVLRTALQRQPYDRDLLFGLAIYSAQANDRKTALGYLATLRELEPDNRGYAELAARLGAAGK